MDIEKFNSHNPNTMEGNNNDNKSLSNDFEINDIAQALENFDSPVNIESATELASTLAASLEENGVLNDGELRQLQEKIKEVEGIQRGALDIGVSPKDPSITRALIDLRALNTRNMEILEQRYKRAA